MSTNKIFIHQEYKNRLSEEDLQYLLDMLDNDDDFYPIRINKYYDGYNFGYYVNVNTDSEHFNKIFVANYSSKDNDPFPIKKKNDY
jgi:hypothetical protein